MKNPLVIGVILALTALGVLLYARGDDLLRWRETARLPAAPETGTQPRVADKADESAPAPETGASGGTSEDRTTTRGTDGERPAETATAPEMSEPDGDGETADTPAMTAEKSRETTAGQPSGEAAGEPPAQPDEETPSAAPQKEEDGAVQPPSFDIVRVEEDGTAVIAGRAAPGASVSVMLDDKEIGKAIANERGEWVVLVERPIRPGDHQLSARAVRGKGPEVRSSQTVALALPEHSRDEPLIVAKEPGAPSKVLQKPSRMPEGAGGQQMPAASGEPERTASAEQTAPAERDAASGKAGGQDAAASVETPVAQTGLPLMLDTVDYNDAGDIIFSGRAPAGATVRLYVDNRLVADAEAGADGTWHYAGRKEIAPGAHSLRLDQINPDGKVVSRVELPFVRAEPDAIARLAQARRQTAEAKAGAQAPRPADVESRTAKAGEDGGTPPRQTAEASPSAEASGAPQGAEPSAGAPRDEEVSGPPGTGKTEQATGGGESRTASAAQPGTALSWTEPRAGSAQPRTAASDRRKAPDVSPVEDSVKETGRAPEETASRTSPAGTGGTERTTGEAGQPTETAGGETGRASGTAIASRAPSDDGTPPAAGDQTGENAGIVEEPAAARPQGSPDVTDRTEAEAAGQPAQEPGTAATGAEDKPETAPGATIGGQGYVIIQPGNNLWRIARVVYGRGTEYTVIYEANKNQIRDPDLIYPGQVFATPGVAPPNYIPPERREPLDGDAEPAETQ